MSENLNSKQSSDHSAIIDLRQSPDVEIEGLCDEDDKNCVQF